MDLTLEQEENAKNIYVIRRKLSELKRQPNQSYYEYKIGRYSVLIRTSDKSFSDCITKHDTVDVNVYDVTPGIISNTGYNFINLRTDSRFCNYDPIQYNFFDGPNGKVNLGSDGQNMPVTHLCELISYLHRLSKLAAFL